MPPTPRETWDTYAASWTAASTAEKRQLFERCLAPGCVYTDPLTHAEGWDALDAYMQDFHRQIPGGSFRTERFIAHHAASVAVWTMLDGSGAAIGDGVSYGEYGPDGRLVRMTGFFDVPGQGR